MAPRRLSRAPAQARQTEVDFLLRRGRNYLALEIKAQSRFSTPQLSGLRAIADLPRLVRRVLVYLGDRRPKTEDGIEVWIGRPDPTFRLGECTSRAYLASG